MLKRSLLTLALSGAMVAASALAFTQDNSSNSQSAPSAEASEHGHRGRQFDPEKRTEMLSKHLNLTSDQQPKVLEILKSEQSQMQSLHSDSSLSREDRHSKMMEIHKTSNDQIRALLDSNQQKKWDEMQSKREQWMEHRKNGEGQNAAPDSK